MQIQLDPNIPTNLTPEQMRDFKTFLDHALDSLTAAAGGQLFTLGNQMLGALALIVVVMTGAKIAFSGNIQPWELVRVVIGIWIPWVMLQFYTTTIPGMVHTFPGMIAAGGNWINDQDFLFGRPGAYTIADYRLRGNGFRTAARFGTPFAAAPAFECWPIMAFQRSQRAL